MTDRTKYSEIIGRATASGYMDGKDAVEVMMDIESADMMFHIRLDDWLKADDFNFAHDFFGIRNNIVRDDFPAIDFGFFIPRFAGQA
ncbi:MAG: hypothetical protein RR369_05220 [Lachnospiraceae bacterium]